jgi:uncharacterized membrane protein YraQ (UPF0718 family)
MMTAVFGIFTTLADWLVYSVLSMDSSSRAGAALHFFVEDVTKIFALLIVLIYSIAFVRASLNTDRLRDFLKGKGRLFGYVVAAGFGAITPFCSCSSIPLFLAFTAARIPIGVTMAFLVTSPLINEVAVVMLGGMLGWKFTVAYVTVGMLAGILAGAFFDLIKAERHLDVPVSPEPESPAAAGGCGCACKKKTRLGIAGRHCFAADELLTIVQRIWLWVIVGVGAGALLHGYVPSEFIEGNLGSGQWWSVPLAALLGIPLYANASGVIPVAESLLNKGLPTGTTLTLMMSVVGVSLPEFVMLRQVMKPKLLGVFFAMLLVLFTLVGWLFNVLTWI